MNPLGKKGYSNIQLPVLEVKIKLMISIYYEYLLALNSDKIDEDFRD